MFKHLATIAYILVMLAVAVSMAWSLLAETLGWPRHVPVLVRLLALCGTLGVIGWIFWQAVTHA